MDDATMLTLITTLFIINYTAIWAIYNRLDKFTTVMRILCREHAKNHGSTEIFL